MTETPTRGRHAAAVPPPERPGTVVWSLLAREPITVEEAADSVLTDACGAVVSFAGVVRDHDESRHVEWLDYSAHPTAEQKLRSAAEQVAARHPSVRLAVAHRVGRLTIGETALAVAAACAHRAEAFSACADLVDTVKEQVPIWKEQGFADGTTEWVGALE